MRYSKDNDVPVQLTKVRDSDAGLDIYSNETFVIPERGSHCFSTGLKVAIPLGAVGLIWSRSGLAVNKGIEVGAGCIDSEYRGEVKVLLRNNSDSKVKILKGDKIAQMITIPIVLDRYMEVAELDETSRGNKGFGSSGN